MSEPSVEEFSGAARCWLERHATRRAAPPTADHHGRESGPFDVSVFHALTFEDERALLERLQAWTELKATRGFHAVTTPVEFGGLGLSREHARAFARIESEFDTPIGHELHSVTTRLIAPTIRLFGSPEQQAMLVADFVAARQLCCQLFSEPGAGSDLAALGCRAVRDGDEWVINGQKVWTSGAQFARWGELIARHDPEAAKHRGMTAFVIPLDLPGIEVRPIRQMSGGTSFNEVFLTDVRVTDAMRLGEVGEGWKVALTTLGFERDHSESSASARVGGSWQQLLGTAARTGADRDPVVRQQLMRVYVHHRIEAFVNQRAADLRRAGAPAGPEGSLGKLLWTQGMTMMAEVVSSVLGARLTADGGDWGTYAWNDHVLGAPGYRIAGGSDETQRNIIGERVLGLPGEPRVDKDVPWSAVRR